MMNAAVERLRALAPGVGSTAGLIKAAVGSIGIAVLTALFFLAVDTYFAEWMPDGEIVILALGFLILSRFFSQRDKYRQRFGDRAYETAFWRFGVPGLGIIWGCVAHLAFIAGPDIPDLWWKPWMVGVGWFLVAAGTLLAVRTVTTMGLDRLFMLYVYHPDQGQRAASGLYELIRHPLYSAVLHIGVGLAFIHASWYAVLVAVLLPLFCFGWVRLVEEKELLQRFPEYAEYRKRVPAFLPWPKNELKLWRLLLGI